MGVPGAGPILLGTHVLQYQALSASPARWPPGWLEQPWSNLLCFLTPVKLYSEVCLCICVSALHAKQNFLPASGDTSLAAPSIAAYLPTPTPLFHSLRRRQGMGKCLGCGQQGRESGASESSRSFLFLLFKMEAYEHV